MFACYRLIKKINNKLEVAIKILDNKIFSIQYRNLMTQDIIKIEAENIFKIMLTKPYTCVEKISKNQWQKENGKYTFKLDLNEFEGQYLQILKSDGSFLSCAVKQDGKLLLQKKEIFSLNENLKNILEITSQTNETTHILIGEKHETITKINKQTISADQFKVTSIKEKDQAIEIDLNHESLSLMTTLRIIFDEKDSFLKYHLILKAPQYESDTFTFDSIVLFQNKTEQFESIWHTPKNVEGVVALSSYRAHLGQPLYLNSFYIGNEFPASDNNVYDDYALVTYYSGKNFKQLLEDGQAYLENDLICYQTWHTIIGVGHDSSYQTMKDSFLDYIAKISRQSKFRIQYNSWFDNMMLIDDESIQHSFKQVNHALNDTGVRILDSYVVDDGFNNYNDQFVVDEKRSGHRLNQSGFWEFNSKFNEGFTPTATMCQNMGSNFGVWIGPRGGYNFQDVLADILSKSNMGSKAGNAVDVADRNYVKHLTSLFILWQKQYHVNYWKWDGFANDAQFDTWLNMDGVSSRFNNHMVGGYQGMYHITDLWEAWIKVFETVRENAEKEDIKNLWLSITCYVNVSPWYLQWVDSVWMQCVGDRGESGRLENVADKMLTYRDAMYFDFINQHQFQFPLKNLYNHDPIYGKEGTGITKSSMSDEQFKNYLYFMGTRGTNFWELYYSHDLLNEEKYLINAAFFDWAETNQAILETAQMIGDHPAINVGLNDNPDKIGDGGGIYGFSCWCDEGIISLRNSDTQVRSYPLKFDHELKLSHVNQQYYCYIKHQYNYEMSDFKIKYGETRTFTLAPGAVVIMMIKAKPITDQSRLVTAYFDRKERIRLVFDQEIRNFKIKNNQDLMNGVRYSLDEHTIFINTDLKKDMTLDIEWENKYSALKNQLKETIYYYEDQLVCEVDLKNKESLNLHYNSTHDFTLEVTQDTYLEAFKIKNDTIHIDYDGKTVMFEIDGIMCSGLVTKAHSMRFLKHNNGQISINADQKLICSSTKTLSKYKSYNLNALDYEGSNSILIRLYNQAIVALS